MADSALTARIAPAVGSVDATEWDRLAGTDNPFTSHAFLTLLEDSGSVGPGTGWTPAPLLLEEEGKLVGAMPSYAKGHSQGEYVFDYAWADAWHRAGGEYYPKLQISAPFTPATGPRLLLADERHAAPLLAAAEQLVLQNGWSSAHATFVEPAQEKLFEAAGWLRREDLQFHWYNRDYASFEDFLGALTSRKRKDLRKERRLAIEGLEIKALTGADIRAEHWDAFWLFYQDTGARKWGTPYLTRAAFDLMGERMGDRLLLLLAYEDGLPIAGALNFIGGEALYGRYWGCLSERRFLHFELCYYRAIDAAIELGLKRVEAGAQGGHKLARGYEPVATVSMHYLADPGFRDAVADFLDRERRGIAIDQLHLAGHTPFRRG
ncbi:GNAT family N-acetyltransferase [Aurantiacibacter sp. MUD11]|uniref:GNAT family N-acetyltransferase n=1 Tax=Aurantiacibacter sp. MUD11 TaxID=3003265 RepID=UPI0022AAA4B1|nr:GNAT family N-acetyltransferase [Aurantiacibacter sp. MUD11]WAT17338.1 GNAT family N-acetyltransferase [Aurantiacibacter sp. MUD11]